MTTATVSVDCALRRAHHNVESVPQGQHAATVMTMLWLEEFCWLEGIFNDVANSSPKLRYPDLISACTSLVFSKPKPEDCIFSYLHTRLVLRDQGTARRREAMWREQYEQLLALQKSGQNKHPHPQFKLDHFTTACVALAMEEEGAKEKLFELARRNIARRAARHTT